MQKLNFSVLIDAPRERVWNALWDDASYKQWTSVFSEGSRVETDWKKGSRVLFLDTKGDGMVSRIAELIPNEYMSFEHLGHIVDGVEDTTSEKVKEWAGAFENYWLKTKGDKTEVYVEMDINDEYKDYFAKTFPEALAKLKEVAEAAS